MLSYVIPVEDKPPPAVNKNHLQLNLQEQEQHQLPQSNGRFNGISTISTHKKMAPTAIHNFINIEQTHGGMVNGGAKKIIKTQGKNSAISTESSASSLSSKGSVTSGTSQGGTTPTSGEKLKPKLVQNGTTKTTSLKR